MVFWQQILIKVQCHFKKQSIITEELNSQLNSTLQIFIDSGMYSLVIRILNSELVFSGQEEYKVENLSPYCDIVDYQVEEDRLIVEVKNLKIRCSELMAKFNRVQPQNPQH